MDIGEIDPCPGQILQQFFEPLEFLFLFSPAYHMLFRIAKATPSSRQLYPKALYDFLN